MISVAAGPIVVDRGSETETCHKHPSGLVCVHFSKAAGMQQIPWLVVASLTISMYDTKKGNLGAICSSIQKYGHDSYAHERSVRFPSLH